jgi:hypothetical protein
MLARWRKRGKDRWSGGTTAAFELEFGAAGAWGVAAGLRRCRGLRGSMGVRQPEQFVTVFKLHDGGFELCGLMKLLLLTGSVEGFRESPFLFGEGGAVEHSKGRLEADGGGGLVIFENVSNRVEC